MLRLRAPLLLAALLTASAASADAPPPPRYVPQVRPMTATVTLITSDLPAERSTRLRRSVQVQLQARSRRLDRCLSSAHRARDPLRPAHGSVTGTLTFDRSQSPQVRVTNHRGVPAPVVSCVNEVIRSVRLRPIPQGRVVIRFDYR